jgi:hypothetical protein
MYGTRVRVTHNTAHDQADAVHAAAQMDEEAALRDLATRILHTVDIERDAIALMSRSQNYAKDPRLALAYFHLCSTDPDALCSRTSA